MAYCFWLPTSIVPNQAIMIQSQESNDHLKLASPLKLLAIGSSLQASWHLKLLANISSVKVLGAQGNHIFVRVHEKIEKVVKIAAIICSI